MRDQSIPSLVASNEGVPIVITIPSSQTQFQTQTNTYNQAGFTYDQATPYGGIYNQDQNALPLLDSMPAERPSFSILLDSLLMHLSASNTNALFSEQNYTYNQTGFSYDQLAVLYAGIYNQDEDVIPLSLSFNDLYTPFVAPIIPNMSTGPGFFMFITH